MNPFCFSHPLLSIGAIPSLRLVQRPRRQGERRKWKGVPRRRSVCLGKHVVHSKIQVLNQTFPTRAVLLSNEVLEICPVLFMGSLIFSQC